MNSVDLLIAAVLLLAAVSGIRTGFVASLYSLVSWLIALVVALVLSGPGAAAVVELTGIAAPVARAVAFIAILIAAETALRLVGGSVVRPAVGALHRSAPMAAIDRALGVVPAAARALIVLAIGLAAALVLPVGNDVRAAIDGSRLARVLIAEVSRVQPYLEPLVGDPSGTPLFVTRVGADERQELDLPDELDLEADPDAERQMVELVNEERVARGLAPLALDPRLVPVARAHSTEMFELEYFSHESPVTGSPFDRLDAAGIAYRRAGENLAYAHSVTVAHGGLMDSPGHRENILRPEFTHIGVGVVSAGPYGRMFTQLFLTPP
ncbi:MAG: CvpA family protein [Candidatus Limnocylindria bacterium]